MSDSHPSNPREPAPEREPPQDVVDTLIQTLFAAHLIAEALPSTVERSLSMAQEGLESLRQLIENALGDSYSLRQMLRPSDPKALRGKELLRHLASQGLKDDHSASAEAA